MPEIRRWLIETVGKLPKLITVWSDFPEHGRNFTDSFSLGSLHLEHRGHSYLGQSMLVLWYRPSRQEMVIQHSQKRTRGIGTLGSVPLLGRERIITADDGSVDTKTLSDPTRSFLWNKTKKHEKLKETSTRMRCTRCDIVTIGFGNEESASLMVNLKYRFRIIFSLETYLANAQVISRWWCYFT